MKTPFRSGGRKKSLATGFYRHGIYGGLLLFLCAAGEWARGVSPDMTDDGHDQSSIATPSAATNALPQSAAPDATASAPPITAPAPPASPVPQPATTPTNPPPDTFSPAHPELNQPTPPSAILSLHPAPAATETPETSSGSTTTSPTVPQFLFPGGDPDALPGHLLVVYNSSQPESKALANYYARRRNIPAERVLGIACSTEEEISRAQYEATIREPIISYIYKQGWMMRRSLSARVGNTSRDLLVATRNDIWAMVLMRGVPLKIAHDAGDPNSLEHESALQTNAAAVDSELALLPIFGLPLGGFAPNPFYDSASTGILRAGPELATQMILVTRLDGPRASDVRRMIDDTLYAEGHRLAGLAVIDSRGFDDMKNAYTVGDLWLRRSQDILHQDGWLVKFDSSPDVIPPTDPLNHVALYLGWYRDGAFGPWVTAPDRFERGAIAYHLHSFSAATVRNANAGWVGPLIAHGAAATMGCVYEPYLDLTPHLDIFTRRMLDGDTFAEAAYASQRGLSWMVTVIGDPLYRPFRQPLNAALAAAGSPTADHYDWLLLQEVQREIARGEIEDSTTALEEHLDVPGAVAQEGLGDLLQRLVHDPDGLIAAAGAYRNASSLEEQPIDRIRVGLKLAQVYENNGQDERAQAELGSLRDLYPADAARFGVAASLVPIGNVPSNAPLNLGRPSSTIPSPSHSALQSATLPRPPGPPRPGSP